MTALHRLLLLLPEEDENDDTDDDWPPPLLAALKLPEERDGDLPKATRLMVLPLLMLVGAADEDDALMVGFSRPGMAPLLLAGSDESDAPSFSCRCCCCCCWRLREKAAGSILLRT